MSENRRARWVVGVTHLVEPPFDPESRAFGGRAEFIHFDSRAEDDFDPAALAQLDALLVWTPKIGARTVEHLGRCRIVVRYGVGFDKIDLEALRAADIAFANNPEYGPQDVADTAMALILALQRRVVEHDQLARGYASAWQENLLSPTPQSRHCTVGVVGVGRIGTSVVNRLKPFGHRILGYDPYVPAGHDEAIGYERVHGLDELFGLSDILTLHCPLTDETRGMVDARRLALVRPGAILVNTARGGLLASLDALEAALREGPLRAAGLDVLPEEPPGNHSLLAAWRARAPWLDGRLLINPHNAFYSDQAMARCRFEAAETARLFMEDGVLRNAVPG